LYKPVFSTSVFFVKKEMMKPYVFLIVLCVLFSCKTEKKESAPTFQEAQLQEDFQLFRSIYEKANAGLYKYHSKREIDSVFQSNARLIHRDLTHRGFYNILWNVIDYTGSCHNDLSYPDSLDRELNRKKIFFPLPLKSIENKLYTNSKEGTLPLGSEVITINSIEAAEFARRVSRYVSTDGHNTTGKYANLATDWLPFYIYLAYGEQEEYHIKYKYAGTVKDTVLSSVTYMDFIKTYKQRHSRTYEERKKEEYTFQYVDSVATGILTVSTFAMGGPESEGHKRYALFLDSVFTHIKTKNIPNLIVDVRGNGGGNDPNDLLLYSYLTQRTFRENTSAFTIFQEIPFPEYYIDDDIDELPKELKEEHSILKNRKYYQNASFNPIRTPKPNTFEGHLIVLIDPFVASAGSLFASLAKSDETTVVMGEETLGGYYGHTGHIPVSYQLPNSGFIITFSIVDLEQDVEKRPDQGHGDGVKPTRHVVQTYEDFLIHRDTQLHSAIEYIASGDSSQGSIIK